MARVDSDDSKHVAPSGDKNQKLDLTDSLVEENLTDEEKTDKAVKEKDKGNEVNNRTFFFVYVIWKYMTQHIITSMNR